MSLTPPQPTLPATSCQLMGTGVVKYEMILPSEMIRSILIVVFDEAGQSDNQKLLTLFEFSAELKKVR